MTQFKAKACGLKSVDDLRAKVATHRPVQPSRQQMPKSSSSANFLASIVRRQNQALGKPETEPEKPSSSSSRHSNSSSQNHNKASHSKHSSSSSSKHSSSSHQRNGNDRNNSSNSNNHRDRNDYSSNKSNDRNNSSNSNNHRDRTDYSSKRSADPPPKPKPKPQPGAAPPKFGDLMKMASNPQELKKFQVEQMRKKVLEEQQRQAKLGGPVINRY